MPDPKRIVESGYDAMADRFGAWQKGITGSTRIEKLDQLLERLPDHPEVLELGSGAGVRSTRILAERGRLTGVDISAEQVRRARERVPGAKFVHADFAEVELRAASFDAVVAFYVFNHVPQEELPSLLDRIAFWLRPGGYVLASFPTRDNPGWQGDWLGVQMFFAGYAPDMNRRLVEKAGLEVVLDELETIVEPEPDPDGTACGAVNQDGRALPARPSEPTGRGALGDDRGAGEGTWQWLLARRPEVNRET